VFPDPGVEVWLCGCNADMCLWGSLVPSMGEECARAPCNCVDAWVEIDEDKVCGGIDIMHINVEHVGGVGEDVEPHLLAGKAFAMAA